MTPAQKKSLFMDLLGRLHWDVAIWPIYQLDIFDQEVTYNPSGDVWHHYLDRGKGRYLRLSWNTDAQEIYLYNEHSEVLARGAKAILQFEDGAGIRLTTRNELDILLLT